MDTKHSDPRDAVSADTRRRFMQVADDMKHIGPYDAASRGDIRRRFMRVVADMRFEINAADGKLSCANYRHGYPKENAEVFIAVSDWAFHWVEDDGIFCENESAGVFSFEMLVKLLKRTDKQNRLTEEDAHATVAMLFHLTPPAATGPSDDQPE